MSFPLKYRVWAKTHNKWMSNVVINDDGTPILLYSEKVDDRVFHRVYLIDNYEPVVQWSTGHKDKTGREIYDGDIITFLNSDTEQEETAVVEWSNVKLGGWRAVADGVGRAYQSESILVIDTILEKAARDAMPIATETTAPDAPTTEVTS
jgi:uncharacterized phage protein (TIGR01671 family)